MLGTWGATVRMSGHRRRSGVKSMGRKAGKPAVTLAVTTPMHRARPSSTACTARRAHTGSPQLPVFAMSLHGICGAAPAAMASV